MSFLRDLEALENSDNLHISRLLILIGAFSRRKNSKGVEGLTKLAKLDFLIRYPVYLERAMVAKGLPKAEVEITKSERASVESSMVRYRYGPWDDKHRRLINIMIGKGLATIDPTGKTTFVKLTEKGIILSEKLGNSSSFIDVKSRANLLKLHFDMLGSHLKNFIYDTFPEIINLQWGEEIPI